MFSIRKLTMFWIRLYPTNNASINMLLKRYAWNKQLFEAINFERRSQHCSTFDYFTRIALIQKGPGKYDSYQEWITTVNVIKKNCLKKTWDEPTNMFSS